jgi:hypothetical protein
MTDKRKPTAAERINALTDGFLYRPGFDALTFEQAERLGASAEAHALYGLLGVLQSKVHGTRPLSRTDLAEAVEWVLSRAMEHERERAAELGGSPRPVDVHARPDDDASTLCGGGGPQAQTGEGDAVTCSVCLSLLRKAAPEPDGGAS